MNYIVYHKDNNNLNRIDEFLHGINTIVHDDGAQSKLLSSLKMIVIYKLSDDACEKIQALSSDIKVVRDSTIGLI